MNLTYSFGLWMVRLALLAGFARPCLPTFAAAQTTSNSPANDRADQYVDSRARSSHQRPTCSRNRGSPSKSNTSRMALPASKTDQHSSSACRMLATSCSRAPAASRWSPLLATGVDRSVTLLFRRDRQIRSEQDLAGKSLGYDFNSDTCLIFEWFLRRIQWRDRASPNCRQIPDLTG